MSSSGGEDTEWVGECMFGMNALGSAINLLLDRAEEKEMGFIGSSALGNKFAD